MNCGTIYSIYVMKPNTEIPRTTAEQVNAFPCWQIPFPTFEQSNIKCVLWSNWKLDIGSVKVLTRAQSHFCCDITFDAKETYGHIQHRHAQIQRHIEDYYMFYRPNQEPRPHHSCM